MSDADKAFYEPLVASIGGGIVGRGMYDAAGAWGGHNPFPGTLVVLTHRLDDQPDPANGFHFVEGLDHALACARDDAGDKDVSIGGGADVIRQALRRRGRRHAGHLDRAGDPRRRQAALRRVRAGRRPADPQRAPVRVGRAHDVRRGALTRCGTPGRPGIPDRSAVVATGTNGQQRRRSSAVGRVREAASTARRRPRGAEAERRDERVAAGSRGHRERRPRTAEIVRAPPRESAIDRAEELKPRSESPESASIATLVRG